MEALSCVAVICLLFICYVFACYVLLDAGRVPSGELVAGELPWRVWTPGLGPGEQNGIIAGEKAPQLYFSIIASCWCRIRVSWTLRTHHKLLGNEARHSTGGGSSGSDLAIE